MRGVTTNVIKQISIDDNILKVKDLKEGKYTLMFLRWERRVDLEVIKGKEWMRNKIKGKDGRVYNLNGRKKEWMLIGDLKTQ